MVWRLQDVKLTHEQVKEMYDAKVAAMQRMRWGAQVRAAVESRDLRSLTALISSHVERDVAAAKHIKPIDTTTSAPHHQPPPPDHLADAQDALTRAFSSLSPRERRAAIAWLRREGGPVALLASAALAQASRGPER